MSFKLDVNYLDSLIKTSQSTEKLEDPIKKTIQLGLQASCSIYVRSGKKNWSGSGFHIGNNIIITAGHVAPGEEQNWGPGVPKLANIDWSTITVKKS